MTSISAVSRLAPPLPAAPPAAGRSATRGADQTQPSDVGPSAWHDRPAVSPTARYGVAAYLWAGGLTADRTRGEARLELSTRVLVDGDRVSVARRLDGGRTVGIEAVVG